MSHIQLPRFFSFFISLALLLAPIPVTAIAQNSSTIAPLSHKASESMVRLQSAGKAMADSIVVPISDLEIFEYVESYNETATRPFTNIIQVQGLLSVNDELVQNITAVSLSVTDEIVQNSTIGTLSVDDALVVNITVTTISITDLVAQNIQATNISVVDETVTGTLSANDEVINNYLRFEAGSTYVGLQAPASVPTSYTLSLPSAVPAADQVIRANATTPTNLEWATDSAFVTPANSETIYVAVYGNDTTGNGSLATPYATVAKAIDVANGLASSSFPVTISIGTGIYVENNSVSPLTVTADGIAIIGQVSSNVILMPNTPANNFMLVNTPIHISDITFESSSPSATGLTLAAGTFSAVINVDFVNFLVGVECVGSPSNSYGFINCFFTDNGTGLMVSNAYVAVDNITLFGTSSPSGPSANNGITATGSGANLIISGGVMALCETGITLLSNATSTVNGLSSRLNTFDINQSGASNLALSACTFQLTTGSSDIEIQVSGAGTVTEIVGCQFDGAGLLGTPEGTAILVTDNALVNLNSGSISNYTTALSVGLSTDTASTSLTASSFIVTNCTNDIIQQGSSTLNLNASSVSSNAITINNSTNVNMAFFDLADNNALTIGSYDNQNTTLLEAGISNSTNPEIQYKSSLYSTEGIGFFNPTANSSSLFVQSSENANLTAVTTTNTDVAGLRLVSDTGSPVGGTTALRGWDVNKNASTAELSFSFQNSDVSDSEPVVSEFTIMQLSGFNNQLKLPTAGTKIVFDTDTNLYRSAANVLKTDSNFIVGTLTPGTAVITDPSTNELESSVTTSTELSYVHGVTSAIQTQINGKVAKAGDTMTGSLTLPAGSAAAPSLQFTGSTNTGLSAGTANILSFDVSGSEKMNLSSSGLTIDSFSTAGVVHNSGAGLLTSSLIVDADITAATITNDKLADISSSNVPGDIVVRDGSGDFQTNMITIFGTTTNNTDVATKAYVDSAVTTGLVPHTPCVVVSTTDIGSPPSGPETIDGYTVVTGDRILLVGQTNEIYNGIWLANTSGAWTYPTDWALGTTAGAAYVLITSGTVNAGSSWLCNTPTATIGTNNITFVEFSLPSSTTGANVGGGSGQVYQSKSGITLNFRTLSVADTYLTIVTNSDNVGFSTNATSSNTASEIVARDSSGNFSAGTITANLIGNVTGNVTGHASLDLPLTGGTLTGTLTVPAGTAAVPSLQFTGSTDTGLSAATANVLSFDISGTEQMNLSSSGLTIDGFTTAGVVHNSSAGLLTSSLIVNADITNATITNAKLAAISSSNIANDIVVRDGSGNFSAGTITASLTGSASLDLPLTGGTLTGTLTLPAGTTAAPSLTFTGSSSAGLSSNSGNLSFSTNGAEQMKISSGGTISIDGFTTAGVVHNDASGNLSSSLIVNADVSASAAITDSKLATISTAGKVANSATTATNLDTASAIVARDASGSFAAGLISITDEVVSNSVTITPFSTAGVIHNNSSGLLSSSLIVDADITAATITNDKLANISSSNIANDIVVRDSSGNFAAGTITASLTGHASLDLALTGGTLTGTLTLPAGSAAAPSLQFTGSTNTGLSAATANTISFDINGAEKMNLSSSGLTIDAFSTAGVVHNSSAGLLSSSLIVDADITAATITNDKLANISSSNIANDIVVRDGTGSFAAQEISMNDGILAGNLILTTDPSTSTAGNIIKGSSRFIHDFGTNNTFVGINAGNFTTSGSGANTGIGASALTANGTGAFNTALGYNTLAANTIGVDNTALGYSALAVSTTGTDNTAIGYNALAANTTGTSNNTAVGSSAMAANTTGTLNVAVGKSALAVNTVGTHNTALGYNALVANTTATDNTALGYNTLPSVTTGSTNIAIGSGAGGTLTTGSGNIYINANAASASEATTTRIGTSQTSAYMAGVFGVTPSGTLQTVTVNSSGQLGSTSSSATGTSLNTPNTLVARDGTGSFAAQEISMNDGILAGNLILTTEPSTSTAGNIMKGSSRFIHDFGVNNTFVGINAGNFTTSGTGRNSGFGNNALTANTTGTLNTAIGYNTLGANTSGYDNTAVGYNALAANTTGTDNTAIGCNALALSTPGTSFNTAVGSSALAANTTGTNNVAVGYQALAANTVGSTNTAVGGNALVTNLTGSNNTAIGFDALFNNTIGTQNTAVGSAALTANTTGGSNTAIGNGALSTNTIGTNNTAIGNATLQLNTTGISNVGIGSQALQNNTIGTANTAVGVSALQSNTTGINNTAIGLSALASNTIGTDNTAVGVDALFSNTTGIWNTAVGLNALYFNVTGEFNVAVGLQALLNNTGSQNTAVGTNALIANTTGGNNTAVGYQALNNNTVGFQNTACGQGALQSNNTGADNVAVGQNALNANTTGSFNTACGQGALQSNITGTLNTAVGCVALAANTIGTNNTAVGDNALQSNIAGNSNTAIGQGALQDNTGSQNTAVGLSALISNTTGGNNTAVGYQALNDNGIGIQNTAVGASALIANTIGANNVGIGYQALQSNSTGNENVAVGYLALPNNTGGGFNVALGYNAGNGLISGTSNIYIGQSVAAVSSSESNITRIANISGINVGAQPAVLVTNTGQLGVNTSTRKVKHAIEDMNDESADIFKLRPVTFAYNGDETETKQYGLIAEEVDEIFPGIVARNKDGQVETVLYNVLPVLLLNEMQKQQVTIEQQQENIENLTITTEKMNAAIASLQEQIANFSKRIKMLENFS
jgi:trimeric autotransporter adhesin